MKSGKSIKGVINYNEQKVGKGVAELILAVKFGCEVSELSFSQRVKRFEQLNKKSQKVKTNALHISLNFAIGEKPDTETLQNIAADYMEKIGFGRQPYLVYRHDDAGHTHIHIVTTPIKENGRTIDLHKLVQRKSEPARKALEIEYALVRAESRKQAQPFTRQPVDLEAAKYGKVETKQAIANIVGEVTANYKFTSLEELNAILRQYNVTAYRGAVGSRQYLNRGLSYSIIDKDGYKMGVPIKASSIYSSPTLNNLDKKFEQNKVKKIPYKKYVQGKVDAVIAKSGSIEDLIRKLQEKNLVCHFERNRDGDIRGISFIDHFNRTIFQAEELGYTAESLFAGFKHKQPSVKNQSVAALHSPESIEQFKLEISLNILKNLLSAETTGPDQDPGFSKKKKKKRRKPM
jgi:hypothetical protein